MQNHPPTNGFHHSTSRLDGFATAHAASATAVLAAVKKVLSDHGITKVTTVGHSLGTLYNVFSKK